MCYFLLRRLDSNQRPPGYEPGEMTIFSTALFFKTTAVFSDNVKRRCGEHRNQNYHCCGTHAAKTGPNDTRRYKCTDFVEIKKPPRHFVGSGPFNMVKTKSILKSLASNYASRPYPFRLPTNAL